MTERDPFAVAGQSNKVKWNYSRPNDPDFCAAITGDVIEIRQVQRTNAMNQQPEFWPDGNPKLDVAFVLDVPALEGEALWSLKNYKNHATYKAASKALMDAGLPTNSWTNFLGMNVTIATQPGTYGAGSPRPWQITINGPGSSETRGCKRWEPGSNDMASAQTQAPQGRGQQQHAQPQFANPNLQHAYNQANAAVTQAQFNVPQQGTWPAVYDQEIPF